MLGKRIAQWTVVLAAVGLTGCCRWCERHCCQPSTCCQPSAPMYAPQPAAYQAPGCCPAAPAYPTAPAYPAPVTYQPSYSQWQRPGVAANGCCE
jgi:hypothetical protein